MTVHSRLACRRLIRTEHAVSSYTEMVAPGLALKDVLTAAYWVNVHSGFRLNDIVHAVAQDGSFDAVLRIVRLGPGFIDFRILNDWRPAIEETSGRFEIGWAGPKAKWLIREIASGKKVAEGLDKPAALTELRRLDSLKDAA